MSSTSWTDFSILLRTLEDLERFLIENETNPDKLNWPFHRILCVITGKGELKAFYEVKIEEFNNRSYFVKIQTLWLEYIDYPKLLHCSDVGVSLHTSTSGLDFHMKFTLLPATCVKRLFSYERKLFARESLEGFPIVERDSRNRLSCLLILSFYRVRIYFDH